MYYKLLNKTLLTSALVSLICVSANQPLAQELPSTDEKDISLQNPDTENIIIEDDVIPLDDSAIIVPEQKVSEEIPSELPVLEEEEGDAIISTDDIPLPSEEHSPEFDENFNVTFEEEPVLPPELEEEQPKQPAPVRPQNPNIRRPDAPNQPARNMPQQPQQPQAPMPNMQQRQAQNNNPAGLLAQQGPQAQPQSELKFGDKVIVQSNNELFNQMSDIEKQTTLLTLELKRERIRNEVEAARAVRERAEQEKLAQEEAKRREEIEWQKEQEAKIIREQVALKQKEIELEKVKQRKALTAYMNSMLEQKQAWINENAKLYDEINTLKETNKKVRDSYKKDLNTISVETKKVVKDAETAKSNYDRTVASLTAQNAQLKKRIEADAAAAKSGGVNTLAPGGEKLSTSADDLIKPINIANEYAIMEIFGHEDDLSVKLINKQGDSFVAKPGTVLATGHTIEEIGPNYVEFDRNGLKDLLYTATGPLAAEQKKITDPQEEPKNEDTNRPRANLISDERMPSLGDSMFVK